MKVLKVLLKTDIYGEPVSIPHANLLHQKTTADDEHYKSESDHINWINYTIYCRDNQKNSKRKPPVM